MCFTGLGGSIFSAGVFPPRIVRFCPLEITQKKGALKTGFFIVLLPDRKEPPIVPNSTGDFAGCPLLPFMMRYRRAVKRTRGGEPTYTRSRERAASTLKKKRKKKRSKTTTTTEVNCGCGNREDCPRHRLNIARQEEHRNSDTWHIRIEQHGQKQPRTRHVRKQARTVEQSSIRNPSTYTKYKHCELLILVTILWSKA